MKWDEWATNLAKCWTKDTHFLHCLPHLLSLGAEGRGKPWFSVSASVAETVSLSPLSSSAPNLIFAAPSKQCFPFIILPRLPLFINVKARVRMISVVKQCIPLCFYTAYSSNQVHSLSSSLNPDKCPESHLSLSLCSGVQVHLLPTEPCNSKNDLF